MSELRAAVVGTGFIGVVHVEALRRLGVEVTGVVGSPPARARREARARVARGDLGTVWNAHGCYVQDWLLHDTDWNWRLDPALGGALRAVADIGTHWLRPPRFAPSRRAG